MCIMIYTTAYRVAGVYRDRSSLKKLDEIIYEHTYASKNSYDFKSTKNNLYIYINVGIARVRYFL